MAMMLPRGFVQDCAYILLAKARELTTMKVIWFEIVDYIDIPIKVTGWSNV